MDIIKPENIRTWNIKNLYQQFGVEMDVLRLDLIHPIVSGNKWFKLKLYIAKAKEQNNKGILTYGGAYSNHIVATAEACRLAGLRSAGVIRGERPAVLSPTLQSAENAGMELWFVTREAYRNRPVPDGITDINDWLMVDEGGYGVEGMKGAVSIEKYIEGKYDHIITAVGTGTTLAGLCHAQRANCIGVSVLKNNHSLSDEVNALLPDTLKNSFRLQDEYHFGGYAKWNDKLIEFMNNWYEHTGIPSDFVYTGKAFFAVDTMIRSGYFSKGERILTLHTGGLQGNTSLPKGTLIFDHLP